MEGLGGANLRNPTKAKRVTFIFQSQSNCVLVIHALNKFLVQRSLIFSLGAPPLHIFENTSPSPKKHLTPIALGFSTWVRLRALGGAI